MAVKRFGPVGIIDIGSNSVRFVAYGGAARVPSVLFNEKVMAALGRGAGAERPARRGGDGCTPSRRWPASGSWRGRWG